MTDINLSRALVIMDRGTRRHYVYFILADLSGQVAVKIGTTTDVDARLSALRTDATKRPSSLNSASLELLGWVEGDRELEVALHHIFAAHRLTGEWFAYPPIIKHINEILARGCLCRGCQASKWSELAHL